MIKAPKIVRKINKGLIYFRDSNPGLGLVGEGRLRKFLDETSDRHHLPDDCFVFWKCGGEYACGCKVLFRIIG